MATYRSRHWTDIPHPSLGGRRQRKIGNHLNYKGPGGLFLPAQANVQAAQGAPPNWVGQFDFRDTSEAAPLQFFAHDATDPDNRAMIGVRVDDTPDVWVNIKAADVVPGLATQSPDSITREWPGLWANSTLRWVHGGHKAVKEIALSGPGHPAYFDFLIRVSPGASFELADSVYRVRDAQGDAKIESQAPYGFDDSADEAGLGAKYIRCTLTDMGTEGPGGVYHRVRLTPNADDLSGAVYPVTLDPTATIGGPGASSEWADNSLAGDGSFGDKNFGGRNTVLISSSSPRVGIVWVDETLIPAGTITDVDFTFFIWTNATNWSMDAYKIAAANEGWVQGTSNGATQTGSSCYLYYAYDASSPTNWAGSSGLGTSGTDYVADASPPSITLSGSAYTSHTLNLGSTGASWFTDWRDTPSNNAGIKCVCPSGGQNGWVTHEDANTSRHPYMTVTYTAASGQPTWIRWTPTHVGGKGGLFRGSF